MLKKSTASGLGSDGCPREHEVSRLRHPLAQASHVTMQRANIALQPYQQHQP